ncbi:methyl-accepting chemotaxis protein [Halopseudomonas litoralis]|uniref:Methyl-accepting chemotaxis protein n=1 Tax=Halopseudomonas litoralis TaxID=797277 RepID=A0A1H1TTM3_9GAMM|nr:methyl-accepting chemotaxis protein [Halopseudomonas litoralis]SDS63441.1 methyl-accepting chemotaxis protein [Halopseudomonas litoralis]
MNTLLAPAMALMNRLGYAMKFCLISALCFIPLIVVGGMLVSQAWDRVQVSRHALDSMQLLEQVSKLLVDAETLRGLDILAFHLGAGDQGAILQQRSSESIQRLMAGLENLPLDLADPNAAELISKRDELLLEYEKINGGSLRNRGQMSTQAHVGIVSLFSFSAAYSGLPHDYDRNVRQLTDLLVNHTPQVTSALGLGRATGAYSIGLGYLNSDASRDMDRFLEEVERLAVNYTQAQSFLQQPELQALRAPAAASNESLSTVSRIFEDEIILASSYDDTWDGYFQRLSAEMAKTHAFNDAILSFLNERLAQRLGEGNRAMLTLVAALAVILLVIIWLYLAFYVATQRTIQALSETMGQVAAGNMTARVTVASRDELGKLAGEFNGSIERIQGLIRHVGKTSGLVSDQSQQVVDISSESSQAVESQRTQIEQVATAMNEMSATSQEVARSAALAVTSAELVNNETINGRRMVESSVDGIEKLAVEIENSVKVINNLADDSASISRVLDVIKGVAEQTNLLALNAAIEAARAGEQGRGFAVVADEVRTLAQRTQQSTQEIEQMIDRLQGGVGAAVKAMGQSHGMTGEAVDSSIKVQSALDNILRAATQIVDQSQQIATAAEEQTAVSHDIDQNIVQINHSGERTADGARRAEEASARMGELVGELEKVISSFRV